MLKVIKSLRYFVFIYFIIIFSGCDENKFWWTFIGFPILGISYLIGGLVLSFFGTNDKRSNDPDTVAATLTGLIILGLLFFLLKIIF